MKAPFFSSPEADPGRPARSGEGGPGHPATVQHPGSARDGAEAHQPAGVPHPRCDARQPGPRQLGRPGDRQDGGPAE